MYKESQRHAETGVYTPKLRESIHLVSEEKAPCSSLQQKMFKQTLATNTTVLISFPSHNKLQDPTPENEDHRNSKDKTN